MKSLEVILSPTLYPLRTITENHSTVVVDILRATSSICAAFRAGASEIVPLNSLDGLEQYRNLGYTLAAERNAQKVMGTECGNSPSEYLQMDLRGRKLAYSTTNGTVGLLLASKDSDQVLAGCFGNISVLAEYLEHDPHNLVILCSGWMGGVSIEDTLFAGCLAQRLSSYQPINDAARIAIDAYHAAEHDMYGYCQCGTHIQRLQKMNYDNDVRLAFEFDTCPVVPLMKDNSLVNILSER